MVDQMPDSQAPDAVAAAMRCVVIFDFQEPSQCRKCMMTMLIVEFEPSSTGRHRSRSILPIVDCKLNGSIGRWASRGKGLNMDTELTFSRVFGFAKLLDLPSSKEDPDAFGVCAIAEYNDPRGCHLLLFAQTDSSHTHVFVCAASLSNVGREWVPYALVYVIESVRLCLAGVKLLQSA